jgi:hypothetical protein
LVADGPPSRKDETDPDFDRIGIFVVTAYDLRGAALAAYRRRRRRK